MVAQVTTMRANSVVQFATLSRQPDRWQLDIVLTDDHSAVAPQVMAWQPQLALYSRGQRLQLILRVNARAPAVTVDVVRPSPPAAGCVELLSCSISTQRGAPTVAQRTFALTASFAQLLEGVLRERATGYAVAVEMLKPIERTSDTNP